MRSLNIATDPEDGHQNAYGLFKHRLCVRYRTMVEQGHGIWLAAFAGAHLVAQLGLFPMGELARFQCVEIHPDYRRRGICAALVADACRRGLSELSVRRLVMVANEDGPAHKIYLRLGFKLHERQLGAYRPPPGPRASG